MKLDEKYSKRGLPLKGTTTDRGSELDFVTEIYSSAEHSQATLIGQGVSSFLIRKPSKRRPDAKPEAKEEAPAKESVTFSSTFKVPASTGVNYAGASGG